MSEESADAAARALVEVPLSVCSDICAWECARLCVGMEPAKPCKAFGWH
jgi:hypothetical protein